MFSLNTKMPCSRRSPYSLKTRHSVLIFSEPFNKDRSFSLFSPLQHLPSYLLSGNVPGSDTVLMIGMITNVVPARITGHGVDKPSLTGSKEMVTIKVILPVFLSKVMARRSHSILRSVGFAPQGSHRRLSLTGKDDHS